MGRWGDGGNWELTVDSWCNRGESAIVLDTDSQYRYLVYPATEVGTFYSLPPPPHPPTLFPTQHSALYTQH
uniref:Uncharacterized protein n=1 Tax=Desertifilum tharense IPPAS B-1220 TaxID=1781255 RepID=A0ACD5GR82_9CYAN